MKAGLRGIQVQPVYPGAAAGKTKPRPEAARPASHLRRESGKPFPRQSAKAPAVE